MGVHGASAFILAVVNNVWVREIRDSITFYTNVPSSALPKYIGEFCLGLHSINAINLPIIVQGFYSNASSMHVYANMLKDA